MTTCTCGSEAVRLMYGVERGCPTHDYHAARRAPSQTDASADSRSHADVLTTSAHSDAGQQ